MEAFFHTLLVNFFYVLFILLIPFVMLVATPFVLIWPGKKRRDGSRARRPIKDRYAAIWKAMKNIGIGLPT